MSRRTHTLIIGLVLGATALTACSSDSKTSPPTDTKPPAGPVLTIQNFAFSSVTAKAGELITIVNADGAGHTVTADDGSFSVESPAGSSSDLVVPAAGTYKIHCEIHSSMHGTIVIS